MPSDMCGFTSKSKAQEKQQKFFLFNFKNEYLMELLDFEGNY